MFSLGLVKEYEQIKKEWNSAVAMLENKLTSETLTKKIKKILSEALLKIPAIKERLIREDNKARNDGKPYEERNIKKIFVLEELEKEIREDLKKTAKPLKQWIQPGDVRNIKDYGLDWFLRIFYKRILC